MENSKEEMLKKLAEMKKELSRKQKKLEKSKRAASVKAHVRQKIKEHEENERQGGFLESSGHKNSTHETSSATILKTCEGHPVPETVMKNSQMISVSSNTTGTIGLSNDVSSFTTGSTETFHYTQNSNPVDNTRTGEKIQPHSRVTYSYREISIIQKCPSQKNGWRKDVRQQAQVHNNEKKTPPYQQKIQKLDRAMSPKSLFQLGQNTMQTKIQPGIVLKESEVKDCSSYVHNSSRAVLSSEMQCMPKNDELNQIYSTNTDNKALNGITRRKERGNMDSWTRSNAPQDLPIHLAEKKHSKEIMKEAGNNSGKVKEHPLRSENINNFWFDSEDFKLTTDQKKAYESKQMCRKRTAKLKLDAKNLCGSNGWLSAHKNKTIVGKQKKNSRSTRLHKTATPHQLSMGSAVKASSLTHGTKNSGLVVLPEVSESWMKDSNLSVRSTSSANSVQDRDDLSSDKILKEEAGFGQKINGKSSVDVSEQPLMTATAPQQQNKFRKYSLTAGMDIEIENIVNEEIIHTGAGKRSCSEPDVILQEGKSKSAASGYDQKSNFEECKEKAILKSLDIAEVSEQFSVKGINTDKEFFAENEMRSTGRETVGSFKTNSSIKDDSQVDRKRKEILSIESDENVITGSQCVENKLSSGNVPDDSLSITPSFKSLTGMPVDDIESNMKDSDSALICHRNEAVSDSEFFSILGITQHEAKSCDAKDTVSSEDRPTFIAPRAKRQKINSNESAQDLFNQNTEQCDKKEQSLTLKNVLRSPEVNSLESFSEYTELDAIPYSQFELTEDFLSEQSQSNHFKPKGTKGKIRYSGVLVKRRSPRISSFDTMNTENFGRNPTSHSSLTLSSQTNFELEQKVAALVGVKLRRRSIAQQKKAAAVLSAFQYLIDEARKAKSVSEFELPTEYSSFKCSSIDGERRKPFYFGSHHLTGTFSACQNSQGHETEQTNPGILLQKPSELVKICFKKDIEIIPNLDIATMNSEKATINSKKEDQFVCDQVDLNASMVKIEKELNNAAGNKQMDTCLIVEKAKEESFKDRDEEFSETLDNKTDVPKKCQDSEEKINKLEYEPACIETKCGLFLSQHHKNNQGDKSVSEHGSKAAEVLIEASADETNRSPSCNESIISASPCICKSPATLRSSNTSTPISRRKRSRIRNGANLSRKLFTASLERNATLQSDIQGNIKNNFHVEIKTANATESKENESSVADVVKESLGNKDFELRISCEAENDNKDFPNKLKAGCLSPEIQVSNSGVIMHNTETITPHRCKDHSPRIVCETPTAQVSHPFHSPITPEYKSGPQLRTKEIHASTPNRTKNPARKIICSPNPVPISVPFLSPVIPVHKSPSPGGLNFASVKRFSFTSTPKTSKSSNSSSLSSRLHFDTSLMDNSIQGEDSVEFEHSLCNPIIKSPEMSASVKMGRPLQKIKSTGFDFQPSQTHEQSKSLISNLDVKHNESGLNATPNSANNLSQRLPSEESYLSPGQIAVNAPELTIGDSINLLEESFPGVLKNSQNDLMGTPPSHVIAPWKKISKTATTPVQVFEEKSSNFQDGVSVFTPTRRRSRSKASRPEQSIGSQSKSLKFEGCFQSCSQDAVVSLLCGELLTNTVEKRSFIVSVQATSLTVWTQDQVGGWQTELDWRLAPEIHIMKACLMPTTECISVVASGWESGQLFVTVFIYDWKTEDTVRFNIPFTENQLQMKTPNQVELCPVSPSELLLGITTDTHHTLGKVILTKTLKGVESFNMFQVHMGRLISLIEVEGMQSANVTLTVDQGIVIWNTRLGVPLKTIKMAQSLPCLTQLMCARAYKGLLLLDALWRVKNETCGGVVVVNPCTDAVSKALTYPVPNNSWRRVESAKKQNDIILAINDGGSLGMWDSRNGTLLGHTKSNITTSVSMMSTCDLVMGEIHGCLHIYHSSCPRLMKSVI